MDSVFATQRGATRNQSTVDYSRQNVFVYGNRYQEETFKNTTTGEFTAATGVLVIRSTVAPFEVKPALTAAEMADVIGILDIDGENVLVADGTISANVCISGDIDSSLIDLPSGITLATKVGNKCLKDVLTGLGFVLKNVTENSKFDN